MIAVHLFGNVAPVEEIEALGVPVVEDAAQAAGTILDDGRRPGALGTIATWSFYPSKNLGAFGDGGAVTTNDDVLAETVRTLRFHGSRDKQTFEMVGHNSRLDELQAGILRVQLPHLDGWADGRRAAGRHYEEAGLGEFVSLPVATAGLPARVAPVRGAQRTRGRAADGAQRRRDRRPRLLPHPGPPAAGDARVGPGPGSPRHRRGGAHEPRASR